MEFYKRGQTSIAYEREGDGYPILLLAPGGMRSANNFWNNMPWNPREKLQDQFLKKHSISKSALLEFRNLKVHFPTQDGLVKAVNGVNYNLKKINLR